MLHSCRQGLWRLLALARAALAPILLKGSLLQIMDYDLNLQAFPCIVSSALTSVRLHLNLSPIEPVSSTAAPSWQPVSAATQPS